MDEEKPSTEPLDADLDRILDNALAKYAAIEAREGLEGRVLANLRAEQGRVPERSWWTWGLAAAIAAVFVVAIALALRPGKPSKPAVADHHEVTVQQAHEPKQQSAREEHAAVTDLPKPLLRRTTRPHASETRLQARVPRLGQFPSPQPLSAEELALARYVREFPQEAVLVAHSQQESELEMQKKMGKTEPVISDEQER